MLATVNADVNGRVLPPLITYAGKNFKSTWQGHKDLPGTMYRVSDSGWMTSEVFFSWFEQFYFVLFLKRDSQFVRIHTSIFGKKQ